MQQMDEYRRTAEFVDVVAGEPGQVHTVYRFPNTEHGHGRAVEYRNAYNESLREAMGIPKADLELEGPDWHQRRDEYDRAEKVELYRYNQAGLSYVHPPKPVGPNDPMPTDYPHEF